MRKPFDTYSIAIVLAVAGAGLFFAQQFGRYAVFIRMTPWAPLVLATGAIALALWAGRRREMWAPLIAAASLVVFACVLLLIAGRDMDRSVEAWRKDEARSIASTIRAVSDRVERLQDLSSLIGVEVSTFVLNHDGVATEDSLGFRLEAFRVLENQATRMTNGGELPPGTEIGIQLFDASGRRIAWAGWPQRLDTIDRTFIASGDDFVYSRQVSLYQILTNVIRARGLDGEIAATVVVDMPLEVNYKVNNKFLKSTSFADDITPVTVADVRFDYSPTPRDLPASVGSYKRKLIEREKQISARREAIGDAGLDDEPFGEGAFPAAVVPVGEISGDTGVGLSGRALLYSQHGNPLLTMTVFSRPFRYFVERGQKRHQIIASILNMLALFTLFVMSMRAFPARFAGPLGTIKALYLVAFLVLVRYWAVWFFQSLVDPKTKLFDPAIYATSMLWGLMRSAGDLLITSIFAVVAIYAILKVTRESAKKHSPARAPRSTPILVLKGLFAAGVLFWSLELASRFVRSVVVNANPRLLGETMRLLESYAALLHLAIFLMLSGIFLAGMILIWGVYRLGGRRDTMESSLTAAVAVLVLSIFVWRWEAGVFLLLLLLFVVFAPRFVQREDLVSIVLVAFSFVIIVSSAAYVFLNNDYQTLRRSFIRERVTELTDPSDNWKVFILEDVLENFSQDNAIRQALSKSSPSDLQRLAFDLWAGSSLSLLGYSCAIHVFDAQDSLVSRFTVEMPYRVRVSEATERLETASSQEWVVLDLTTSTPRGIVRFYRGIVNIGDFLPGQGILSGIGKVVVDIPFFFESLAWAARTGPQTPEVLRNVQEGGIEPRLEETEALLLANLRGTRVVETSSDVLPVGFAFPREQLDQALNLEWPLLVTDVAPYRFLVEPGEEPGNYLLAGFPVPKPLQHVLRWSTILSLYFFFTVGIIVLIIALKSIPLLRPIMPTLTPGRQVGFQQKLLASFLLIALLPSVILGVFSIRLIKERFVQENKKEALYKAFSAQKSISNVVVDEMTYVLDHSDLRELVSGHAPRDFAYDPNRLIRVYVADPSGTGRFAPVDSVAEGGPVRRNIGGLLDRFSADQVFVDWIGDKPYFAVLSQPLNIVRDDRLVTYVVYYARRIEGDLLGAIADQVGADVNVYDRGELIATSREGLLFGGFISSTMDANAFVKVSLMHVDESLVTEQAGLYTYEVAYLPIQTSSPDEHAAIGLPLLFTPESYHVEVQRTSSIVLGIFALLSAATMGLGLLLARGIFEPLKGLLEGTKRISRGDLKFKLPSTRRDEIGTVVEAFNEMTDQLSRSQNALEERRRYLEVILANIGTGVVSTDATDHIRAVNNAAERILNVKGHELMGKTREELGEYDAAYQFFTALAGPSTSENPFVSSEIDLRTDGRARTIKYMKTRLSTDGRYLGTVYVFEDLTELINSKKLSAWVEMARQIAHEIKNPLTPIKLSTQFMVKAHREQARDFNKIFEEGSETIIKQVEVLRHIASEFSSFGRLQQLKLTTKNIVPQLHDIVAPYTRNTTGVDISVDCESDRIEAIVDAEAVRKICTNLIENAMEAMPNGGRLEITCTRTERERQPQIALTFRDTGTGLSEEVRHKLFEPYFSTKTTGTGLGLAICRSLSREMGGDVVVTNVGKGQGVEATLYLRAA